jgi:hypothetical protein
VIFDGQFRFHSDPVPLLQALGDERQPGKGKSLTATHMNPPSPVGVVLVRVEYVVRGGYPDDVRKVLRRTADRLGLQLEDVQIKERSRERLEDA